MIWLTDEQARTITQHALGAAPCEACGLIGGRGSQAYVIVPVDNIAANPHNTYYMDPAALVETLFRFEQQGLSLIGIYHSHPGSEPVPSPVDIQQAHYPDVTHIIAGVHADAVDLAAWRLRGPQVDRVHLHIGPHPPENIPSHEPLSPAQKAAVLLSAALAFLLLIVISVTLLPPAPPIP